MHSKGGLVAEISRISPHISHKITDSQSIIQVIKMTTILVLISHSQVHTYTLTMKNLYM